MSSARLPSGPSAGRQADARRSAAPNSQREMRERNLSRVLYAVAEAGRISRASAAARIGLTRGAVSTLVEELLRGGLLDELGPGHSGGVGRPGSALTLPDRGPCGLGAEIGVDHLAVCAVDLRGETRARAAADLAHPQPASEVADRLRVLVREVADAVAPQGLRPAGLTVAVPGTVERGGTTVVHAPNLDWHGVDLAHHLGDDLPLTVENEANLAALAELWIGEGAAAHSALRDFVRVSAEVGVGAGLVLDGELLRGTRGFAGEFGHVPVRPEGAECACGGRGCLEQYAGAAAVLRTAAVTAAEGGEARRLLTVRAEAGDAAALHALHEAGTALGTALAGAVNLLDPRAVVLGGALADFGEWVLPPVERELGRRTAARGAPVELCVSPLGPDAALLGAAHAGVRRVLDSPLSL
ncbi:ROK family transcriptional regulator [Streptomyces xiaopingdaonensis]|uniref:ROK family transcriptional regulator n=1 Tax=Streptomyces xiaopingdaonensis TaxID=1565415 RepID=UPI0002F6D5B3|nr:ROK family transcriptional regulator [Streptomyces xiaopingdaonensis]